MTKITIDKAVLEQALDAVEALEGLSNWEERILGRVCDSLRQALEQPNEFHPDWDQIKPFNDRIAELEKVAKQALEALEVGRDYTFETAEQFHIEMRGYKQQRHDAMDADVRQIDASITALRQALSATHGEQPEQVDPCVDGSCSCCWAHLDEQPAQQKTDHDIPDLIAGALGVSRGTAYDLMREALAEQTSPGAGTGYEQDLRVFARIDAMKKLKAAQQEPVIDKSAAIRIATVLGWEPKREWVGLTDEEVKAIFDSVPTASCQSYDHWRSLVAHAIEQSLRSKNEQT